MAAFQTLPSQLPLSQFSSYSIPLLHFNSSNQLKTSKSLSVKTQIKPPKATVNGDNGAPKPSRRGRKKGATNSSTTKTSRSRKTKPQNGAIEADNPKEVDAASYDEDYDDGIDFPYEDPPLVCCFGAAQKEFVPSVRISEVQMHPDIYSEWKMLQWKPPEFVRAPGGPPSNVAIAHVRLGGRAAFMGKVGRDEFGEDLVLTMNKERVQTRGVKIDSTMKTACSAMKIEFVDGKMKAKTVRDCAEDSLLSSELNLAVLKEVKFSSLEFIDY